MLYLLLGFAERGSTTGEVETGPEAGGVHRRHDKHDKQGAARGAGEDAVRGAREPLPENRREAARRRHRQRLLLERDALKGIRNLLLERAWNNAVTWKEISIYLTWLPGTSSLFTNSLTREYSNAKFGMAWSNAKLADFTFRN